MQFDVMYGPAYSICKVGLTRGEAVRAESWALVAMDPGIAIQTQATGGFMKSLSRSLLGGESFFQNTFTAEADGNLYLAPSLPGDIIVMPLSGRDMLVQSGSYIASSTTITVDSKWGGSRTFFGGEGLFMLRCSGNGPLVVCSYGAIHKIALADGKRLTVDTGHLVAFDAHMPYSLRKVGNWKATIFGGEGIVTDFQGPGDVYIQTRSQQAFLGWLLPQLPQRSG